MKIVRGNCGHIKARWDNHHNCLKCSSCSRLSTCSTCSTWSEETCMPAARKLVMTRKRQKKKKRLAVTSDLSDDNTSDGSTSPQGYTARYRSTRHWAVFHQSTRHWAASHRSPSYWSFSDYQAQGTGQLITRHQSLVIQSPVTGQQN